MAKRRFLKANINFISLCPRGMNRLPVIYKSAEGASQGSINLDTIVKASENFDDNGEVTAVVYAPELRDSEGDIASAKVIKEAMYEAARNGISIDVRHAEKALPKTAAFIAESFLVQKGDSRFNDMKDYHGEKVDVTGAWAVVIKIEDAALRKSYRSGEWNGISMGGTAAVEMEKSDSVLDQLVKLLKTPSEKEPDMTKEELAAALAESNKVLLEGIAKALKPAEAAPVVPEKKTEVAAPTAPVFKGDMSKPEDVKAHQIALKKFNLAKACDFNDDKSVEVYLAEIAKLDAPGEKKIEKSAEVIELERQLTEANKRSNQPAPNENNAATATLTKSEDLFALGKKMAADQNARRALK